MEKKKGIIEETAEEYAEETTSGIVDKILAFIAPRIKDEIKEAHISGGIGGTAMRTDIMNAEELTVVYDENCVIIDRLPGNVSINASDYEGEAFPLTVVVYKQTNKMKYEK